MKNHYLTWLLSLVVVLSACSSSTLTQSDELTELDVTWAETVTPAPDASPSSPTPGVVVSEAEPKLSGRQSPSLQEVMIELSTIPAVDLSQHSVPLDEIFFDTFRRTNRAVPLDSAEPELIRSLLDAIPPIYNPRFETAEQADEWIRDNELVLGYASGQEAFAYPVNILNFHEIVRHNVDGIPTVATYCPLCRSGVVYDSRVGGETLLFGNTSALYESDMVMVDHVTGSYWVQVSGEAIVGPMTGERLIPLPSQMTTWKLWKLQHPDTYSLSRDTGYRRDYNNNPFAGMGQRLNESGQFVFPVSERARDARLQPGEIVLGVESGSRFRAYPIAQIGDGAINDQFGETAVVVFALSEGPSGAAYSSLVEGKLLTFYYEGGQFRDKETDSSWSFAGEAIAGGLAGAQLTPLSSRSSFWFALVASYPELELIQGHD